MNKCMITKPVYESPVIDLRLVHLEQCIAGSGRVSIEGDDEVTETWEEKEIDNDFNLQPFS